MLNNIIHSSQDMRKYLYAAEPRYLDLQPQVKSTGKIAYC